MSALENLRTLSGHWSGANLLQDPNVMAPETSKAAATVTPVLGGRFVRVDYTWAYHGEPQEGSLQVGYDATDAAFVASWIDTWHLGGRIMACRGGAMAGGGVSLLGSYAAPPGPDWGWRITIEPAGANAFRLLMYNITPEGTEELAVEAEYTRT